MKAALRTAVRARLRGLSDDQRGSAAERVTAEVLASPEWARAGTVFVYLASPRELPTRALVEAAWGSGKRLVVPKVLEAEPGSEGHPESEGQMDAVLIETWEQCAPGFRGLLEPVTGARVEPDSIDLVLAPGLAFDRFGRRLGQGGGYYDRFLPRLRPGVPVFGLGFAQQLVDEVPSEPHDRRMDAVVVEGEGLIRP